MARRYSRPRKSKDDPRRGGSSEKGPRNNPTGFKKWWPAFIPPVILVGFIIVWFSGILDKKEEWGKVPGFNDVVNEEPSYEQPDVVAFTPRVEPSSQPVSQGPTLEDICTDFKVEFVCGDYKGFLNKDGLEFGVSNEEKWKVNFFFKDASSLPSNIRAEILFCLETARVTRVPLSSTALKNGKAKIPCPKFTSKMDEFEVKMLVHLGSESLTVARGTIFVVDERVDKFGPNIKTVGAFGLRASTDAKAKELYDQVIKAAKFAFEAKEKSFTLSFDDIEKAKMMYLAISTNPQGFITWAAILKALQENYNSLLDEESRTRLRKKLRGEK
ncbi:MAG: hypothetical protein ACTSYA_06645 [Candidatus Kariarchaeaceae archaeon]